MACVACEQYEKRITNVFRDEELKEKFEKLIGYSIIIDCFICDTCNNKLQDILAFQENCIKVYKKNNPNYQQYEKSTVQEEKHDEYLILQASEEVFLNEGRNENHDNHYTVFQINDGGKEVIVEESVRKKSPKSPSKLKNESQKCLIIENQSETEDDCLLMNDEGEIIASISEDQSISYKLENSDVQDGKKARKSYTVQQKLEIIEYAEKYSNREAARKYSLNESTIRCFRRQKDALAGMDPKKSTKRHGTPYWPDLEARLKEWTEKQPNKPKMNDVREEAINIAKSLGYDNFSGSNTYIFKFMQRNNIEAASPRPRKKIIKLESDEANK